MDKKYSIGEVAEICNIPVKTLRYYDEIGLVVPVFRNHESKYRYYHKKQMVQLFMIRQMRTLGFSLKQIKALFEKMNVHEFQKSIQIRLDEIENEIAELEQKKRAGQMLLSRMDRAENILSHKGEIEGFDSNDAIGEIHLEKIPEQTLAFSRGIMKQYKNDDVSLHRWIDITDRCMKMDLQIISPIIVTYYNDLLQQYLLMDCDVEFGVLVNGVHKDETQFRMFGGFEAVTKLHVGKYSEIMMSHVSMIKWINEHGYEVIGPVSEEFIVSPVDIDNEDEHITKIIMPVRKKMYSK